MGWRSASSSPIRSTRLTRDPTHSARRSRQTSTQARLLDVRARNRPDAIPGCRSSPHGWQPPPTLQIPDWCGCSTEYLPVPVRDGWWQLVPIWEPARTPKSQIAALFILVLLRPASTNRRIDPFSRAKINHRRFLIALLPSGKSEHPQPTARPSFAHGSIAQALALATG